MMTGLTSPPLDYLIWYIWINLVHLDLV